MLRFRLFGFPVFIHWTFWLIVVLLGHPDKVNTPEGMQKLLGWVAVVLVSIVIHELGHALTMRHYGDPRVLITLHSFGGFASGSRRLTRTQDFFVSAAGPFVQIAAGVVMMWILDFWRPQHWLAGYMAKQFVFVSIVWAFLNLLPIIPLDGGRISLALFGPQRERMALILSLICAVVVGIYALMNNYIFSLIILGMMAFNNFKRLKGEPEQPWMGTP